MPQPLKDSFLDLERHRQLLEDNVEKLRKSLRHWQAWEAEYESLKEEIRARHPPPTREQLIVIGDAFEGVLVTKTEVEDILGITIPRSTEQVVNILDRRIDYVVQNVQTIQKQLDAAGNKLATTAIISSPDVRNEEGLPLMEIVEELDEEGNIISGTISTPGSARGQLLEILKKAGVKDLPEPEQISQPIGKTDNESSKTAGNSLHAQFTPAPSKPPKKAVTFTEDTKPGSEAKISKTAQRVKETMSLRATEKPIIPADEPAEEAALRREMLEYGMSEIGPIVAELNLDEDSDFTDEEYNDETMNYDDDDDDDEDHYGRSTQGVMTAELRQKMKELEGKLGFRKAESTGPKLVPSTVGEEMEPVRIQQEDEGVSIAKKAEKTTKTVRLATEGDNSPSPSTTLSLKNKISPAGDMVKPISRSEEPDVMETGPPTNTPNQPVSSAAITSHPRTTPTPPSMPLAAELVERSAPHRTPLAPDELDPVLLKQEVATEYYRVRNRLIGRQGGFNRDADEEERQTGRVEYDEAEGGPKLVSRFKAARIARQGH